MVSDAAERLTPKYLNAYKNIVCIPKKARASEPQSNEWSATLSIRIRV